MEIHIDGDDWGETRVVDIQRLLDDVAGQLLRHLSDEPKGRIRVQCRPEANVPHVLYRNSADDDYVVWLTARNRFWAQFAYQFAHEFCHILSGYDRLRAVPNKWFHESLCELASIFTLKQMAVTWLTQPPYPNWREYADSLEGYVDGVITRDVRHLPDGITLGQWFHTNESTLRANPLDRDLNGVVAQAMLPLFQSNPESWQTVGYLPDSGEGFARYLSQWKEACPRGIEFAPSRIAQIFGIEV